MKLRCVLVSSLCLWCILCVVFSLWTFPRGLRSPVSASCPTDPLLFTRPLPLGRLHTCDSLLRSVEDQRQQIALLEEQINEIGRKQLSPRAIDDIVISQPRGVPITNAFTSANVPSLGQNPRGKVGYAYVFVISNEQYVDGALVLGYTLRKHSPLLQSGTCDLVLLVTQGRVCEKTKQRLSHVGFNNIVEVISLAKRVPNAHQWKDTFDKLYVFNLTAYDKIVFMDTDMLVLGPGMDKLFTKTLPSRRHVGAIGGAPRKDKGETSYFQTGMMLIHPSAELAHDIFEEFESNIAPRNKTGLYTRGDARDGLLVRNYFQSRYMKLDTKYSRYLNPRIPLSQVASKVIALHFRGGIKPWYDRRKPNLKPELGKKEFGHSYVRWWKEYEEIHHGLLKEDPPYAEGWGGKGAGPNVSPRTHVWMMRYSPMEYVQLLGKEDIRRRNNTIPGLIATPCAVNESCTTCCLRVHPGTQCVERGLRFSWMNDCQILRDMFPSCKSCGMGIYSKQRPGNYHPGMDADIGKCFYNYFHDDHTKSTCDVSHNVSARLCPCVPLGSLGLAEVPLV